MKKLMYEKLKFLREFQAKYPTAHVGGSIGLMLRGVSLQRDLTNSDLDITIDEYTQDKKDDLIQRSNNNDFDFALCKYHDSIYYTKIDIRVCPEPSFDVIEYLGEKYNVSKLRDILFWKKKYADKGVFKHQNDLSIINTGKPLEAPSIDDFLIFLFKNK